MKKLLLFTAATLLLLSSCKKEDDTNSATPLEAAEIIGNTFSNESGGATAFIESSVQTTANDNAYLRTLSTTIPIVDTTFSNSLASQDQTRTFTYSWDFSINLKLNPTTYGLDTLISQHTYTGTYTGPYATSTHSGNGKCYYTNLGTGTYPNITVNTNWTMNGTYHREGTFTKIASGKVFTHQTNITFTNVVVNKNTKKIVSGTATITFSGSITNQGDFSYTGTLTFNGNGTGTLTVGGKTYTVTLSDGTLNAA